MAEQPSNRRDFITGRSTGHLIHGAMDHVADNLAQFHLWQDWRQIMDTVPVGVLARPGDRISARMSPAARIYARFRISPAASHLLAHSLPPAWCFVNVPMMALSSSAIRARGDWSSAS